MADDLAKQPGRQVGLKAMTVESDALPNALDPLGVLVMRLGPDGTVLNCNSSVCEILGLSASAILGRHHQTLFGSMEVSKPCVVERTLFRAARPPCKIRWSLNPEFDPMGKPNGMSCLGAEIESESQPAEQSDPITKRHNDGVFRIDGNGRVVRMNRSAALDSGVQGAVPELAHDPGLRVPSEFGQYQTRYQQTGARAVAEVREDRPVSHFALHVQESPAACEIDAATCTAIAQLPAVSAPEMDSRHLHALRDVLKAAGAGTPVELTRAVLPRIAELVSAQAAAVTFKVEGYQVVEFFGLPPETAPMVLELLSVGDFSHALLGALTRLHVLASKPLAGANGSFGHVLLFSRHESEMDAGRLDSLDSLTRSFAVALENIVVTKQIETVKASRDSAHESILRAMVAALELRDQETEGHTQRVTRISLQLGESLGLRGDDLRNLEHGALLHDVGKIGIPDAILHKPGPLNAAEWETMRKHPQFAYDILSPLPHLSHALDVPYCHHERYDGSGYPRGLEGSDIPLAARIFAVVDVFDAMTTERPYRPALPEDYAMSHLQSHAGTHFDPVVVEAFQALVERKLREGTPLDQSRH